MTQELRLRQQTDELRALMADPNADPVPFTPENLRLFARMAEDLRADLLFCSAHSGCDAEAEQFFFVALSHMETAARFLSLAAIKQSQALAARRC